MSSRYQSRKFHRSPKVPSPSCQVLPTSSSTITQRQFVSPNHNRNHSDSYEQGFQNQMNYSYSNPILNSLIERINILEVSIREEKSERLDDHTKLLKMIKQMQCKHSSIIYDSEIKFNKAMPELFNTIYQGKDTKRQDEVSIKKVSSYVFEKNMPHIRSDYNTSGQKTLRGSQAESSKITQASQSQLRKSAAVLHENPEKAKTPSRNGFSHKNNLLQMNNQHQQEKLPSSKVDQKINIEINKRLLSFQEEITNSINKKFIQVRQEIKGTEAKVFNQINAAVASSAKSFQQNFTLYKQSIGDVINNLSHQINEIDTKNTNVSPIQMEQIHYKMQEVYGIINDFSSPFKQKINEIENSLGHFNQRINNLKSLTENNSINSTERLNHIENYLQKSQPNDQQINALLNDFSNPLKQKISEIESYVNQLNEKINNMKALTEVDYSNSTKRLNQIENYFTLKLQSNERQISTLQNNTNKVLQQIQLEKNRRATEIFEAEKRKQQFFNLADQKLLNKFEQLKISTVKDLQQTNLKMEDRLVQTIEKHIGFIENYLKNIEQKQKFLFTKYFTVEQPIENKVINSTAQIPKNALYVRPPTSNQKP